MVNWLISHFFCDNTKWEVVSFPHYLKILFKSTKHGLSYSLKCDWKSIFKITFVGGIVLALMILNLKKFSQKLHFFQSNLHYLGKNKNMVHPSDLIQAKIMLVWITNISFCENVLEFGINKANTKPPTNVNLEIDFQSRSRL